LQNPRTWIVSPDPAKMRHIPREYWERGIFESAIQAIQDYRDETYGEGNQVIAAGWYHDKKTADGQEQPHVHLLVNTRVQDDVRGAMTEDFNVPQLETFNKMASQSLDRWMERELGHERYTEILGLYHAEQVERDNAAQEERNREQRERRARMKKEREDAKRAERELLEIVFDRPPTHSQPVIEVVAPPGIAVATILVVEPRADEVSPELLQSPAIAIPVEPIPIKPTQLSQTPSSISTLSSIEHQPSPRKRVLPPQRGSMNNPMTLEEVAREQVRERRRANPWWKQLLHRFQPTPNAPDVSEPILLKQAFTKEQESLATAAGFDLSDSLYGQPQPTRVVPLLGLPKTFEITQLRSLPEPVPEPDIEEDEDITDKQEMEDEYDWDIDF